MADIIGKNVLVTGGAGFIGSHLCDALLKKGVKKVVCLDNFFLGKMNNIFEALKDERFELYRDDARKFGVLQSIIEREKIDVVFNLATIALNYSFINPFDAYMVNVEIANALMELLKMHAYHTLIHTSSSEAYGTAQSSPMSENHPTDPTTPYAAGKASADMMIHSFSKVLDLDISIIRPFNNYGPRQNSEGPLAGIIPLTAKRILRGGAPTINGDGDQTRDFIYVEDTVRGLLLAYEREASRGKIINLGTGNEISMNRLLRMICEYMNYNGEWKRCEDRTSDVRRLCADITLAREVLEFEPLVSFEEGLKITLDWYMSNASK